MSGPSRFLLRLPPSLHAILRRSALETGVSLNEYCVRVLATSRGLAAHDSAPALVQRAASAVGPALIGIILYGSWVRGSAGPSSDVDALVVIERSRALTRTLYTAWEAAPVRWDGRQVDVHFVYLAAGEATSVWAEAATDGVVLFERGLRISRRLSAIRQDIAAGRLLRRTVHGQPYWVAA